MDRRGLLTRLLGFLGPARREFLLGASGMGLINLGLNLGFALIMARFTRGIMAEDGTLLLEAVLGFVLIGAVATVCIHQAAAALMRSATRSEGNLREVLFRKLLQAPLSALDGQGTGDLLSRLNSDATQTAMLYRQSLQSLFIALFNGIGSTVALLVIDWRAGVLVIGLSSLMLLLMLPLRRPLKAWSKAVQESQSTFLSAMGQLVQGAAVIRYFNLTEWFLDKVQANTRELARSGVRLTLLESVRASIDALSLIVSTSLIVYGAWRGTREPDFVPKLLALVQMSSGTVALFGGIVGLWGDLQVRLAAGERLLALLDLPDEPRRLATPPLALGPVPDTGLAVQGLGFSYGDGSASVLRGVSFHVLPGQRVAFVGPPGAGKSTLFKLLLGLYRPTSGGIWLDGRSISEEDLDSWRRRFAYVPQSASLFSGTVYDNILGGLPDPGPEAIERAARAANAHDFILALPAGYRTVLEEGARNLSGGQRQRLAIARAILQEPAVLLLDEPTSALDGENEQQVRQALSQLMTGRMTIIISHRLSTILDADQVLHVEEGELREHGRHREQRMSVIT